MKRIPFLIVLLLSLLAISVAAADTMYAARRGVRVRKEPHTTATVVTTLKSGAAVTIIESVNGDKVSGSTLWYHVNTGLFQGYIHSSLLTSAAPGSAAAGTSSGASGSSATAVPNPQSTPAPLVEQPVSPPPSGGGGASCNGATTCGQMTSCDQAYACLAAGRSSLDRDHDGVPCESICPGG